jgi:ferredoxin
MYLRNLKKLRVAVAVVFFVLTTFLFVDFRWGGVKAISGSILFLQFVPSLLSFIEVTVLGTTGFIAVLLITFFFGRVYCSTVCPFGVLQDGISRIFIRKPKYSFAKPYNKLRYTVLGMAVLLFLAGSGLMLNLLDPFSNFGRIVSNLVRPVIIVANNLASSILEYMGYHLLYREQLAVIAPLSIGVALVMLSVAGWLSVRHGRLYCNTLCPVGALLSFFAQKSLYRIRFSQGACRECGRCESVCKAGCINFKEQAVDAGRCVSCYNCLAVCPDNVLKLSPFNKKVTSKTSVKDKGRRNFLIGLVAGGMTIAANKTKAAPPSNFIQSRPTTIPVERTSPISPPGSRSIKQFTSQCTACHLCVSACPSRVLSPASFDYGLSGMMQPQMSFQSAHCNFDCTVCSEVCPSGAILPLIKERKHRTQIGVARFIRENCVVYTDNTNCGACSEHCPTKAVHMVPYPNSAGRKLVIPEVNENICIGCGGCEHACPTRPYKAIYVDGNPVHKLAEKPVDKGLDNNSDTGDYFPF